MLTKHLVPRIELASALKFSGTPVHVIIIFSPYLDKVVYGKELMLLAAFYPKDRFCVFLLLYNRLHDVEGRFIG